MLKSTFDADISDLIYLSFLDHLQLGWDRQALVLLPTRVLCIFITRNLRDSTLRAWISLFSDMEGNSGRHSTVGALRDMLQSDTPTVGL